MAQQDELSNEERQAILRHIERLREEHRDLDAAIDALLQSGQTDRLQVQRLKKRKLQLRDKLSQLEDSVTPDIIACKCRLSREVGQGAIQERACPRWTRDALACRWLNSRTAAHFLLSFARSAPRQPGVTFIVIGAS